MIRCMKYRWIQMTITKHHHHRPFILTTTSTISSSLSNNNVSHGEQSSINRSIVRKNEYSTTTTIKHNANSHNNNTTNNWKMDSLTGHITNIYYPNIQYQLIIGLEIHAQLNSNTKLFSSSYTGMNNDNSDHNQQQQSIPNNYHHNYVNMYDIAIPGILPVLSSPECIQKAILASAAFQCDIQSISRFERKHYMYADIPLGYQLTQQRWPIAKNGSIQYELNDNIKNTTTKNKKKQSSSKQQQQESDEQTSSSLFNCRINRIQIEQDTGKTTTSTNTNNNITYANVDYNRAGVGLIEIVTEPDLRSVIHTISCIQTIRHILKHCNVCYCKMELGQFRVDANVNIQQISHNDDSLLLKSSRIEIKNLNSIQQIQNSILYEAIRHAILLTSYTTSNDNNVVDDNDDDHHHRHIIPIMNEETRTWNVLLNQTELIRRKDGSEDYRFLPDPDLPPILLNTNDMNYNQLLYNGCNNIHEYIEQYLPELPYITIQRFIKQYQLSIYQAKVIVTDPASIDMMDDAMKEFQSMIMNNNEQQQQQQQQQYVGAKTIANLLTNELLALVKTHVMDVLKLDEQDVSMIYSSVTAKQLAIISYMLNIDECITKTMAKQLLSILFHQQIQQRNVQQQDGSSPNKNDNIDLDPYQIAIDNQLQLITDMNIIQSICNDIIQTHQDEVFIYQKGNRNSERILKVFIGKAMIELHNNVHPQRLQEILKQLLDNHEIIIRNE